MKYSGISAIPMFEPCLHQMTKRYSNVLIWMHFDNTKYDGSTPVYTICLRKKQNILNSRLSSQVCNVFVSFQRSTWSFPDSIYFFLIYFDRTLQIGFSNFDFETQKVFVVMSTYLKITSYVIVILSVDFSDVSCILYGCC